MHRENRLRRTGITFGNDFENIPSNTQSDTHNSVRRETFGSRQSKMGQRKHNIEERTVQRQIPLSGLNKVGQQQSYFREDPHYNVQIPLRKPNIPMRQTTQYEMQLLDELKGEYAPSKVTFDDMPGRNVEDDEYVSPNAANRARNNPSNGINQRWSEMDVSTQDFGRNINVDIDIDRSDNLSNAVMSVLGGNITCKRSLPQLNGLNSVQVGNYSIIPTRLNGRNVALIVGLEPVCQP